MAAPASPKSYKEVILFLATAGVVVPLFLRLKISPVLGFLGAGVLLGPLGLGRFVGEAPWLSWITIGNRQEIAHLAEFGVVFLLFMIGIELSWERLWTLRRFVFGLGSLQVVACAAVLGAIAFALGAEPAPAAFVGVALALSSTAIVVPVLAAQKRLSLADRPRHLLRAAVPGSCGRAGAVHHRRARHAPERRARRWPSSWRWRRPRRRSS